MSIWKFKVFLSNRELDTFEEWLTDQDKEARVRIRNTIAYLANIERHQWGRPYFAPIGKSIYEIRVQSGKKQYRIFGCFGFGPQTFTLLIGTGKKGKTYTPKDAIKTAQKRRKLIDEDRGYLGEY
ncbi:MAG: type II toxin-antitoxin system RelE/ParE family toxin [Deltaproteobacteria bacterium]|nr:type II toxin-antitoxin system RelE/ParE family toxin [Deltaproteobacteria bacterium]